MKNQELIGQSFGPLQGLIEDESVEEIWINTPNQYLLPAMEEVNLQI